jgi:hypothetical protein
MGKWIRENDSSENDTSMFHGVSKYEKDEYHIPDE